MLQLPYAHDRRPGEGDRLMTVDSVQHINLKIFIENPGAVDLADAVGVFHRWIKDSVCPEMLIDVADYLHVPEGPGILLIGHEANYSLDDRESRPGLLYNRKAPLAGTFQSRVAQAHEAALGACDRLEQDAAFEGKLRFDRKRIELFVNDRLFAPNTDDTWSALQPELKRAFPGASIERRGEPRDLFRVSITQAKINS
ncbi:MAG: hypothetical protein M3N93_14475 [Acidobacteriota bacterium]|nr:hypothetical protein [Acidobacteriota bacterium]